MTVETKPIVVLGANGFIGAALVTRLAADGKNVRAIARRPMAPVPGVDVIAAGTLDSRTDWATLLGGARAVVHLASPAETQAGDETWISQAEVVAHSLAVTARQQGIDRVVLLSSIKAMGDTSGDTPFHANAVPSPSDAYGRAKLRIEAALANGPALSVLRPPLVYGPGVRGNFHALLGLASRGLPLPLGSVRNRRSLVFIDNLIDLIVLALDRPEPAAGTFLLRDAEEVSTPDLIRRMARQFGREASLFPCPPMLLSLAAAAIGHAGMADRLLGSISIDDSETRAKLGWNPRISLDEGLAATCRWYVRRLDAGPG